MAELETVTVSGLPNAATPLTGAERVPMDQGNITSDASTQDIANLAPGTNLTYDAATRLLASSTGADVTLPVFSSSLAGLVGASGGGTSSFLRADGTWAAPPASAGTDLSYDQAIRLLSSSTGADVTLPLATDALDGLQSAAHRALVQALIAAGVTAAGSTVTIPHIHGDIAGSLYVHIKNTSGGQLTKGTFLRITGQVGDTPVLEVAAADPASAATMPAFGVLAETIGNNDPGHAVVAGELLGLNTAGLTQGAILYVAAGGGWTVTRPTSGVIQQMAIVGRVHASTGGVTVTVGSLQSPNWDTAYSERLQWDGGATGLDAGTGRASLGLGSAAQGTIGTAAGNVVALDGSSRLPAVDGSQLTGLPSAPVTSVAGRTGAIVLAVGDVAYAVATNDARLSDARAPLAHTQAWSTITGTPTTLSGYGITDALDATTTRAANLVLAGPTSGAAAAPTFRALVAADLPAGVGGGTKTLARFTARDNRPPAASFATLDTRNSVSVLEFDAATEESAVFVSSIPEGANLASGLLVRIWWMADTATSGNVRWAASFERSGTDLDADSFDSATEATSAANGTSGIESIAEITCTAIDSLAAGERFRLRIARKAADATNDTMTGDAQLFAVEVRGVA